MAHRLALVTCSATFVLILFGGLVTNTGAALAVPDWPTTFGHNMFLYPWSRMVGGIFYEHSHRLIGAAVGALTLVLAAVLWRERAPLRWLGLAAAAAVCVQGLLGGLRVVLLKETLAILHGCLAQTFFALLAAIAFLTWRGASARVEGIDPPLRLVTLLAAVLVYAQVVFGALLTHAGWIELHLAAAAAVYAIVPIVTARLHRSGDPVAAPLSRVVLALLMLQFLLGIGSLGRYWPIWVPGGQPVMLALPVAHRLAGGLILCAMVTLAIRATAGARRWAPSAGRALATEVSR